MHVDKRAQFGRRILRQLAPDRLQFLVYRCQRMLQALHFGFDLLFRHQVVLDVERRGREQMGAADCNTARNRNTV